MESDKHFLNRFLASTPDAILLEDKEGKILRINESFTEVFGWKAEDVIGRHVDEISFIPLSNEKEREETFANIINGKKIGIYRTQRIQKDGTSICVSVSYAPILGESNEVIAITSIFRDVTELQRAEEKLLESKQRFQSLFEHSPTAIFTFDTNGIFLNGNKMCETLTGYTILEMLNTKFEFLVEPEQKETVTEHFHKAVQGEPQIFECAIRNKYDKRVELEITTVPIIINGKIVGVYRVCKDVSKEKQAILALRDSEERYRKLVEMSPEPIIVHREGIIIYFNQAVIEAFAAQDSDELIGKPVMDFVEPSHKEMFARRIQKLLQDGHAITTNEIRIVRLDGTVFYAELVASHIQFDGNEAVQVIIRDITKKKEYERKLEHLAYYDPLTNVPNRRLFHDRLSMAIAQAKRNKEQLAIMYLDFDKFKWINDNLGHDFGDELLKQLTERVKVTIRESDTIARLGGDEFAIILPKIRSRHEVEDIAERIIESLNRPWKMNNEEFVTTTSIGISIYPTDGEDPNNLLKSADLALYNVKRTGSNGYHFFRSVDES